MSCLLLSAPVRGGAKSLSSLRSAAALCELSLQGVNGSAIDLFVIVIDSAERGSCVSKVKQLLALAIQLLFAIQLL